MTSLVLNNCALYNILLPKWGLLYRKAFTRRGVGPTEKERKRKQAELFPLIGYPITLKTNKIYHRSLMQTKKSQPEGIQIMLETRFTEIPAFCVDPRVGISRSASETND